jgi:hypothetical protein
MKLPNGMRIFIGKRRFIGDIPDNLVSEEIKKQISDYENKLSKNKIDTPIKGRVKQNAGE